MEKQRSAVSWHHRDWRDSVPQDTNATLGRLGFFHFVQNYDQPIPSLEAELRKHDRSVIAGSLIVLPETFNLGRYYWDNAQKGGFLETKRFLSQLAALATLWKPSS
jgi:hypothetical protein